jgi:hypothetical protein
VKPRRKRRTGRSGKRRNKLPGLRQNDKSPEQNPETVNNINVVRLKYLKII